MHFESNLGQINFDISLTKGNKNEIKMMLEQKMSWLPSGEHDMVLAQFDNLSLSNLRSLGVEFILEPRRKVVEELIMNIWLKETCQLVEN